jgi:hypothetical protein
MEPLIPITLTINVPVDALELATIVKVELVALPETGVTGEAIDNVTPVGVLPSQAASNVTGELKPFIEVTVIVAELLPP